MTDSQRAPDDPSPLPELLARWKRGHRALAEALPLAAQTWEQARPPRADEDEVWTPREVAAHAIGADLRFCEMIAQACGLERPVPVPDPAYDDPTAAEETRRRVQEAVRPVLAALTPEHLGAPTEFADNAGGVLRVAAWHLRDHAQQMLGVRDSG